MDALASGSVSCDPDLVFRFSPRLRDRFSSLMIFAIVAFEVEDSRVGGGLGGRVSITAFGNLVAENYRLFGWNQTRSNNSNLIYDSCQRKVKFSSTY